MKHHRTFYAAMVLLTLTLLAGCTTNPKPVTLPPGALSQADLISYEALVGAQAVIESVKTNIALLPPAAKPVLNKAIQSYNIAEASWQAVHSGKSNDQAGLQAAVTQLTLDVTALISSFTGAK